ncbi:MAG: CinA family nicotinamide mononucleotide deamidase-related protein [Pseudomonadota bacterium]
MNADILATGDEIRTGALVDTNTAYIAEALTAANVTVARHLCVGDDMGALVEVLRDIGRRCDLAVVTGGLGPTSDDLSAAAAAAAAGVALKTDLAALASMEAFFSARGRVMGQSNRKQADLPDGAVCLPNPVGTAPGFALTIDRCRFFFLPGVPGEMRRMMADQVMPRIGAITGRCDGVNAMRTVGVFGLTEASVNRCLDGFAGAFADIKLGFRARFPVIEVKLYGHDSDKNAVDRRLLEGVAWVRGKLGENVFTDAGASMAAVVGALLLERSATVAVAESCTGGLVSHWLTDVPGSSRYFVCGAVTYANEAKIRVLGVPEKTIAAHGAVSEETVRAMAAGAARVAHVDVAVATSGIAGPDGGTADKPVGTVWIAVSIGGQITSFRRHFPVPDREKNKALFAMTALDALRRVLLGLPCG